MALSPASHENEGAVFFACALLTAIAVLFLFASHVRNRVWISDMALWEDTAAKSPRKSRPHNSLGVAYAKGKRLDEAIGHFRAAIAYGSGLQEVHHFNIAIAYMEKGSTEEAASEFKKALALKDDYFDARYRLIHAYRELGMLEAAGEELKKIILQRPDDDSFHNDLGNIYLMRKKYALAIEEYGETLKLNPGNAEAMYNIALSYEETGRSGEARRYYNAFLESAPPEYEDLKENIRRKLTEMN